MEIVISIIIGIAIVFIMINFINRKKMDEFDDFSRKKENKENKEETDNVDRFGHKITSIDDIVEVDYSQNYEENDKERDRKYRHIIFFAYENIISGNYRMAREKLEMAAGLKARGNYELGKFYYYCKSDNQNAVNMFRFAYNDGINEAVYYLGKIEEESGNIELAIDWYNEGAKKGDINSITRLGKIAEEKNDYKKAEEFYLKAADTKDAGEIYNLVNLYFKQDRRQKVVEWQKKLMNEKQIIGLTFEIIKNIEFMLGSEKDKKHVELINQGNEFLEKRDYENARKLFTEAINYNERGYLELAKSYYAEGKGEKTKEVFERAYEMGVKEAAYKLGQYMDVVEGNEKESEKWYKIGKEIGDARAIYQLAMLYETSREFGKSEEEAYGIFEISANMKYAPAIMDMVFYSDRAENKNKVKEWTSKLLNETGLIELGKNMIGDAQNFLEEMGEKIEDKISGKDYEIEYDEDLIYFIKKFKSWN